MARPKITDYHSALHPPVLAEELERHEWKNGIALHHDVMRPLPEEFDACDILYAEIPWRDGLEKFNRRAGVKADYDYAQFLKRVEDVMRSFSEGKGQGQGEKSAVLITGRHARKHFSPREEHPVLLNGAPALALPYGNVVLKGLDEVTNPTSKDLIYSLSLSYDTIGDFTCGYGTTGRIFVAQGKRCVLSDYNAMCIGHIAVHSEGWAE